MHSEWLAIITDVTGWLGLQLGIPNSRKGQLLSETCCRNVRKQNKWQPECLDVCVCVCVELVPVSENFLVYIKAPGKLEWWEKRWGAFSCRVSCGRCCVNGCVLGDGGESWIWLHWGGYLVELFTMKCNSARVNEAAFFFFFFFFLLLHSWSIVETVSSRLEPICVLHCVSAWGTTVYTRDGAAVVPTAGPL